MSAQRATEGDVQATLYRLFITEKRYRVEDLARRIQRGPWVMRDYVNGRRTCPPEVLSDLYLATHDRDFLSCLLDSCGVYFCDVPAPTPESSRAEALYAAGCVAVKEATDCLDALRRALADGQISRQEVSEICREASEAHGAIAYLAEACRMAFRASGMKFATTG